MVEVAKDYAIYMMDLEVRVITWNIGAGRLKGYSTEEILGRHFSLFYEPGDVESGKPEHGLKEAAATGHFEDEGWRVRKDGSRFWGNAILTALKDGAGGLQGFVKVTRDMSERKQAEEALRTSEERFRRYFELGLVDMATTSPTKGILEVNDELCRILGYEGSELLQKTWAEMTYPDDLAADIAQFKRVLAGEIDGYTMDKRWIRKDGRVIHSILSAKCLRRADGSADYFVGMVQDITERKQAEESAQAPRERVEMILASISDPFFGFSKDWRFTFLKHHAAAQMKVLGKDPAGLIGKVLWDEFPEVPNEAAGCWPSWGSTGPSTAYSLITISSEARAISVPPDIA